MTHHNSSPVLRPVSPPVKRRSILETALSYLEMGLWPILVTLTDKKELKKPIGTDWGLKRWTPQKLQEISKRNPRCGVGVCLGPGRGPGGAWLIDRDGDGPRAEESSARFLGGEVIDTYGWSSARGGHGLFRADGERLLDLLKKAGGEERKGKPGVWHLKAFPDLELRIGGYHADGSVKQVQSVVPPTPALDGTPREWNGIETFAELPEGAYAVLEAL